MSRIILKIRNFLVKLTTAQIAINCLSKNIWYFSLYMYRKSYARISIYSHCFGNFHFFDFWKVDRHHQLWSLFLSSYCLQRYQRCTSTKEISLEFFQIKSYNSPTNRPHNWCFLQEFVEWRAVVLLEMELHHKLFCREFSEIAGCNLTETQEIFL